MSLFGTVERFGGGDDSWLGSAHAVDNATSGTLNADEFDVEDGIVLSGTPVAQGTGGPTSSSLLVPYDGGDLAGFVIGDHSIADGNKTVPILWHGRINVEDLPVDEFLEPVGNHQFTFNPAFEGGS